MYKKILFKPLFITITILSMIFIQNFVYAQATSERYGNMKTPFNISEIIEKVSHHPMQVSDKLVIKDRIYEAFFDEHGITLKPRLAKGEAEDLFIPLTSKPEIKDGKVIYNIAGDEFIFEGASNGLKFQQISNTNYEHELRINYTGNVAKLVNDKITGGTRTGEFIIDTNVVYVSAVFYQGRPSIAFNGTNYLVVWEDDRNGITTDGTWSDIYGARVSNAGIILDPAGIAISTNIRNAMYPSVSFGDANYLVVWEGLNGIFGARVNQTGIVLDPSGITISSTGSNPVVAFDGTNFFVVWEVAFSDIFGARVNQTGTLLDTLGIAIATVGSSDSPSVTFGGTNYLVAWQEYHAGSGEDIYGARITQAGILLDTISIAISTATNNQESPAVAFDDTTFMVVWEDRRGGSSYDIYGTRVDTSGAILNPSGINIATATNDQTQPVIVFGGTSYLVAWQDKRNGSLYFDVYGTRVSRAGLVLEPSGIDISTATNTQTNLSVAFDGTNYLVVWEDWRSGSTEDLAWSDIYGARVNQSGTVLDPSGLNISTAAYDQGFSALAFDGSNYLVVWQDWRSDSSYDIYGARVDQIGNVLDPSGIAISTAPNYQLHPAVAFDGTNYLVVWEDRRGETFVDAQPYDIYGARVNQQGIVLDPLGIAISTTAGEEKYPSVAFGDTNYLVVWHEGNPIYGARVNKSGTVLDPSGILISDVVGGKNYCSVAFGDSNYLVVWQNYTPGLEIFDIFGVRVSPTGVVLDPTVILVTYDDVDQWSPCVAFDGTNYLVVYEDFRFGSIDIYGTRVKIDGSVIDTPGIAISTGSGSERFPALAFDNTNYLVVWQEWNGSSLYDIYGAKVNPAVMVIDTYIVAIQTGNQLLPAIAHGNAERFLVTYSGFTDYINSHPAYTFRIWGKLIPEPGIEEDLIFKTPAHNFSLTVFPNPFSQTAEIRYQITDGKIQDMSLAIYDVAGRMVKYFDLASSLSAPASSIYWNGRDDDGKKLPAGVYIIRLKADQLTSSTKVIKIH